MPHDPHLSAITLAVLAGGEGKRMGFPKSNLRFAGLPILEYLARQFSWPGPTMLVTSPGREHPPACKLFGREVADRVPGIGPLQGVLTALENSQTPTVIVTTVDMPHIAREQLDWLARRLNAHPEYSGILCQRIRDDRREIEPFPMACRIEAAEIIARGIDAGNRSVRSLLELSGFTAEAIPREWPEKTWTNLNTPGDLEDLTELFQ